MSSELPEEALNETDVDAETDPGFSSPSDPAEIDGEVFNEGQDAQAPEGSVTS